MDHLDSLIINPSLNSQFADFQNLLKKKISVQKRLEKLQQERDSIVRQTYEQFENLFNPLIGEITTVLMQALPFTDFNSVAVRIKTGQMIFECKSVGNILSAEDIKLLFLRTMSQLMPDVRLQKLYSFEEEGGIVRIVISVRDAS